MESFLSLKYAHPETTKKDVLAAIDAYKNLSWKFGRFVFNNGCVKELLNIEGTIPINYKGNVYNIPICIWLMDTHPQHAPMCFVKPTSEMHIKTSIYVDQNGKIYLPYLHDWSPNSDLLSLIQVMIIAFGEFPPVFSKPRTETQATPYPLAQPYMPMPMLANANYPLPTPTPAAGNTYPSPYMSNLPYPSYPPQPPSQPAQLAGMGGNTITEEHIRVSLLSAIEDKLKLKYNEYHAQTTAELEILQQTNAELQQGQTRVLQIIEKMEKEKTDLEKILTILKEREAELEKAKTDLEERKDVDIDEAVTTTTPLYKQILTAYAEEAAMEDALYYLGEALRRGVIDLDVFLKQIRTLSRKQFMLRALMQKCRQKAGLKC